MNDLVLSCSWDSPTSFQNKQTVLTVVGLQLEGAVFNPHTKSLSPNTVDSPDVSIAPPILLMWTAKVNLFF